VAAERLLQCARASDTVARLGGDELAVLIEDPLSPAAATALAERIAARLAEPIALCGREVRVTASIGISQGGAAAGADALLGNADLAMYSIKHHGKQGHALFEPVMHTAALEWIDLEQDLRAGLARGEFLLHYQPLIHLATNGLAGVEALVRWQHPRRGVELPSQAAELRRLGCPLAQGYLFSRRLDAATLSARWIASRQDPYKTGDWAR